ncbi:DUF6221 family protein [Streptomyces sp. NPDC054871]
MTQSTAQLLALADFNDVRLNEDEQTARAATPGPWHAQDGGVAADDDEQWPVGATESVRDREDRVHIARHDPARVLLEVAAKRTLIANWRKLVMAIDAESDPEKRERLALTRHGLDQVAFQLAAVHDQHPDYQEGWRP